MSLESEKFFGIFVGTHYFESFEIMRDSDFDTTMVYISDLIQRFWTPARIYWGNGFPVQNPFAIKMVNSF